MPPPVSLAQFLAQVQIIRVLIRLFAAKNHLQVARNLRSSMLSGRLVLDSAVATRVASIGRWNPSESIWAGPSPFFLPGFEFRLTTSWLDFWPSIDEPLPRKLL